MPDDELRWIEKYRAALNKSTRKPKGLLEAIARTLGVMMGRIIAKTQRTAKVSAQVSQPESPKPVPITQGENRSTDKRPSSDEHNVA